MKHTKVKRPESATITNSGQSLTPRRTGKRYKPTRGKQTNTRKAHSPALSSPSEVIAMLKGPKTKKQNKTKQNKKTTTKNKQTKKKKKKKKKNKQTKHKDKTQGKA